ncbi:MULTISPECIES: hypothetical protein [Pseudobutyrivibrio]|jgi:uncharacterized protein Yka (UPF0111/DUF47 family)|uniref:Uncharacterized protein n=1 Tax=Pseudobutyrivibrio ruminis TaxID=46206 RepID=A0A2G3DXH8_9FIRM|nr:MULTISPECIES: hypothetical protein [Pseudobutyrivibrio]PHU35694.1 hypothetical protein CSX01_03580 [Pseudobutyrivibrio ruminis]SCY47368.1 hypothetical protein SAMN05660668_02773 [Pseudobutyrivibrio sp. AR14]
MKLSNDMSLIDNKRMDKVLDNMFDTAANLEIPDEVFRNEFDSIGTEAMIRFAEEIHMVHEMSNTMQPHMNGDIVPALRMAQNNLGRADRNSSLSINAKYV